MMYDCMMFLLFFVIMCQLLPFLHKIAVLLEYVMFLILYYILYFFYIFGTINLLINRLLYL